MLVYETHKRMKGEKMRIVKKAMAVMLAASLAFTSAVPARAEQGYDTDNTDLWKGLKIITAEVPQPENEDIRFDSQNNIICCPNVKFQLDVVIDSKWSVSPAGQGVSVDASGLVTVDSGVTKDTTYTITATPENIKGDGKSVSIKVTVPRNAVPAVATDICFADTMEMEGVSTLSEDKKTLEVTGAWTLPIETVISPSYIADQSVEYKTDVDNPSIEVEDDYLSTTNISKKDNILNCQVGATTGTMGLNVKVTGNPFGLNITSDDTVIDRDESDPVATVSMDQRVQFDITENSDHALNDYGKTSVTDYQFAVSGDTVVEHTGGREYEVYDESGTHKIATIDILGYGSDMKAVVKTETLSDTDEISKWKLKNTKITLKYKRNENAALSTSSVTIKYNLKNAGFNTVGLDFGQGGLVEDEDYAVYNETISFKDEDNIEHTKEMPVYYFESNYTDEDGNVIDNPLYLHNFTFANGDYKSTVNTFNEDKDKEFYRESTHYPITFKLSDIETVATKKNKEIGTKKDTNLQSLLTYTDDDGKEHCDALLRRGIGYKLITVNYGNKHEYYVIRFVSRSNNVEQSISMVKNSDKGTYYDLLQETVHVRKREAVVPVYKNESAEQQTSTQIDPFLTYTVQNEECANAFADGNGVYGIGGRDTGKTTVVVQGKVNKSDKVAFHIYVNEDVYKYEDDTFSIDFTAALNQELIDSSDAIDGKREAVPVNVKVVKAGAALPDIEWRLEVKEGEDFIPLDASVAEITADKEAGSAIIKTKKACNDKIYVKVYDKDDTQLASKSFTIAEVDGTDITEIAELVEDGGKALVEKTKANAGVCGTGDVFKLTPVEYSPSNATRLSGKLTWSSSNEEIAKVENDGTVTALSEGNVEIRTSYTVNGNSTNQVYALTVQKKDIPVTGIECAESLSLTRIGATENLEASVVPENATNKALKYEIIGDQDVVDVSSNGVVTGKKVGTTQIRISSVGTPSVTKVVDVEVKGEADRPTTTGTPVPTQAPSQEPTQAPSQTPSQTPSQNPTQVPTQTPSQTPSQTPAASVSPSADTGAQNQGNANNAAKPAKGKVVSVKNVKGKKAKVKVKAVQGAIVYQITYSAKKNFAGAKNVKTASTSCVLKKLKKGKTYFVKVRAYNSYGYGAYSAAKKVKIKK